MIHDTIIVKLLLLLSHLILGWAFLSWRLGGLSFYSTSIPFFFSEFVLIVMKFTYHKIHLSQVYH